MANVTVTPAQLQGEVHIPPSKSDVHRAILCAALAKGTSRISPVVFSNDIQATIHCVKALGAAVDYTPATQTLTVDGTNLPGGKQAELNCGESGSTLRFLIPIAAAGGVTAAFTGEGRLPQRPIGIYLDTLPKAGVTCQTGGGLPLTISGQLQSGTFTMPGNVSSQFITGLLLALPLLNGDSKIILTSPLESVGYIHMTLDTMAKFGVTARQTGYGYFIPGNQQYQPVAYTTQGDWSQAAFFLTAGALQGSITVTGVDITSAQGDKEILDLLTRFGAEVTAGKSSVTVIGKPLRGITIDAQQIPDLVPVLAVAGALAQGTTSIINAQRLRIKESDRLEAITNALNNMGANVTQRPDGLKITGVPKLRGGTVEGCNDHRIVMAASIAALGAKQPTVITDGESINKSYPSFFEDYNRLGGNANGINMGQ